MSTVIFVGGGSIGHISPSVAVAQELANDTCVFICSMRAEERAFIVHYGYTAEPLHAPRLGVSFVWRFPLAYFRARTLLTRYAPRVVFSKGGYVSVPVCLAAKHLKVPIVLHESDAVSGRANTLVARWAQHVCYGFPIEQTDRIHFTGNPIRKKIEEGDPQRGHALTRTDPTKPTILITGGSQGSETLNEWVVQNIDKLLERSNVIHLTGKGKSGASPRPGYYVSAFATEELPDLYAISDVAVSRAGASNITELAAARIPTILVPLRGVAHDHQQQNALKAEQSEGCVVINQSDMNDTLLSRLEELLADEDLRHDMSKNIGTLHVPDAARQIAELLGDPLA